MLDLGAGAATLSYAYWFHTVMGTPDAMAVEASNDDGTTWTPMQVHMVSASVWRRQTVSVCDFIACTSTMRIRFSISDPENASYTEGLIDDVVVTRPDCPPAATIIGAISRKSCDLPLVPGRTSEPRGGGVSEVSIAFDVPPGVPNSNGVTLEWAPCGATGFVPYAGTSTMLTSVSGHELEVAFKPGLENGRTYRITLGPPVTAVPGQSIEVRGLLGDVNADGWVDAADRSVLVGAWTGAGAFSCATDLNGDGRSDALDRSTIVSAWTGAENCAP
jgi:hypothetical protein